VPRLKRKPKGGKYSQFEPIRGELGQREALTRLWHYLRDMKGTIAVGLLFTLLWSGLNLGYGGIAKLFLEAIPRNAGTGDMRELNYLTAVGMFVFLIRGVTYFVYNYAWTRAGQTLSMRMRNQVYGHMQTLPNAFFDNRKTGQLMSTLSNDIPCVNNVLGAIQDSVNAPIIVVGGVILLFWLNWPLALLSCVCMPPIAIVILRAARRIRTSTTRVQDNLATLTEYAEETISGIRIVKSFGNEEYEAKRYADRSRSVYRSVLNNIRIKLAMTPLVELIGAIAIILALWVGGHQIIHNSNPLTIGDLTWFVLVLKQVADGCKNLGSISVSLTTAGVAADRVFTLLNVKSDIRDKPDAIPLDNIEGRVAFENVGFAYVTGLPVLQGIDFVMEPGEVVAIVGPTGSGKTTIASLIPRFYDVREGRITVDGIDLRDCQLKTLRREIGIVPQDTMLFAGTLRENILYGRLGATEDEVIAAAKMANAWEFIERCPDGLDTIIGERGVRLSGGQRQRIAIARAVLRDPKILILDEATSSLDTQSEALVQDALQKLVADRTTLVIAHRLSTIRNADKILVIKDGHIVEEGRHAELLAYGGVYSQLYNTQFRWEENEPRYE
jgi:ATP-binding cassette, subfamily B, bacterial MsbA